MIGRAVKECKTPWKTRDEASEAIKLSLGIVNLSKTVNGHFMQYPKSLTELTDPELEEALMQMMEIIQHITGVDPDEWKKQIGDLGQDDEQNVETSDLPHASDAGSEAELLPGDASNTEPGGSSETSPDQSSGSNSLTAEDKDHLLALVKRLKASIGDDERVMLATGHSYAAEGRRLSDLAAAKAATLVKLFRAVCRGERAQAEVIEEACGIAQVEVLELGMDL